MEDSKVNKVDNSSEIPQSPAGSNTSNETLGAEGKSSIDSPEGSTEGLTETNEPPVGSNPNPDETIVVTIVGTSFSTLKNQKAGEFFSIELEDLRPFHLVEVLQLPQGLSFDTRSRSLSGTPKEPGDFKLSFIGRSADGAGTRIEFKLCVVPDPKTLWKEIPTDKSADFFKKDTDVEIDSNLNLFAVAASKRGRSHAHEGKFREDDFSLICDGLATWNVFAVADGGGAYKYSRRGSQIAAKTAVRRASQLLETYVTPLLANYPKAANEIHTDHDVMGALYRALIGASFDAAKAVENEANSFGREPREFSTTLLLVAVRKFQIGHVIVGFNIGDGASGVIYNKGTSVDLLCVPESGEFAGQTRFLGVSEFQDEASQASRLRISVLDTFDAIALMSDGVSDAKFPNDNSLSRPEFWTELIFEDWGKKVLIDFDPSLQNFPPSSAELGQRAIDWLDYWATGTHDDRTLIVAIPKEVR